MLEKRSLAVVLSIVAALAAGAQEKDKEKEGPRKVQTPLKLQIVFARYQGEKKVNSMPYTLAVNANGRPTRLRMGIQVPIQVKDAAQYRDVGSNLDCSAQSLEEGGFWLACTLEQSLVYSVEGDRGVPGSAAGEAPLFRTFRLEANVLLRDGQSAQFASATDPVSGEVLKVDVTLSVLK